jgi:uncharacterized protein (AIM24 family)
MLKATGQRDMFLNAYDGIIRKDLGAGEKLTVTYRVNKVEGMKTTLLGGEGLATEVTGPGSTYFQTKNIREFIDLLGINQRSETTSSSNRSFCGFRIG